MDEKTYGNTPAAMYLVRVLNKIDNKALTRSVSRRIKNTASTVNELLKAYEYGLLSPGSLSNTLRLMRLEISDNQEILPDNFDVADIWDTALVDKLRRNVQIGHIKYAIRLSTLGRKVEQAMQAPQKRAICIGVTEYEDGELWTYDVRLAWDDDNHVRAGEVFDSKTTQTRYVNVNLPTRDNFTDSVSAKLLHERSDKRCLRQGKPHMVKT
jgi:hypothetical protein